MPAYKNWRRAWGSILATICTRSCCWLRESGGASSGIVIARGAFNIPRLVEAAVAAGAAVDTYKGVQVLQGKTKGQPSVAFLDSDTVVLGEPANVLAAVDRKATPGPVIPRLPQP